MTNPALSESPEASLLRQELADALGDRYQLGEILGGGRAGIVFRAKSAELGYDVAIKTAWHDDLSRAQMLRELTLTAEVNHPNVVEMRQVDAPAGMIVVEMPLLTGYTAHDFLENGKPVPFEKVVQFMRGLADALDTAHAAGIIHAGLCPVKILLDAKGQPVLSDFGLRAPAYPGHWYDDLPDSIGAPAYTPLEQRHNEAHLDGRIDQYALAIIAFELIRGRRTWHVNSDRVVEVEPIEILQGRPIAPGVPTTANMALRRATSRDPAYRYATVTQFADAFAGKAPAVVAAEHIHREAVVEKRRSPYALVGVVGVLAVLAVFSRQTVRESVGTWWRTKAASSEPMIFPRDRDKDRAGNDRNGSSGSSGSANEPASPPPPSHPESQRLGPPGEPNNTRVGSATPQGSASGNSSNSANSGGGGRTFDIFPKTAPAQTTKDQSGGSSSGSSDGGSSSRPGAVAPKNGGSDRQREADATAPAPINVTGVLTVSTKGDGFGVVVIDGQSQGRTPLTWRGSVGRHTVTLRGVEDYSPRSTTINVSAKDTARVTFTIKQP
jgi:serine/threonine protein kinase